jgi:dolichol-phosphate mannosyltransferase
MGILIFIPTYNERGNVARLCQQLNALREHQPTPVIADILFVDDNSPDGTGEALDQLAAQYPHIHVIHRAGKEGIGTAHQVGIRYAYAHGYDTLITMDCDGTHPPEYIPEFLAEANASVAVGSRYLKRNSLDEWTWLRRIMTYGGHTLTRTFLNMPYDASSAYRRYRLKQIPLQLFDLVQARGYGFFFESLYALHVNHFAIHEVGIILPARGSGESKMSFQEAWHGISRIFTLWFSITRNRKRYHLVDSDSR